MQPNDLRVLVVEDNPEIAELLRLLLERDGYRVELEEDGLKALEDVDRGGIDLMLLDLMLPGMHGLEVCRRVRARARDGYLPIVMLTALAGEAERHEGFAAGANDYVTKPFEAAELLDRVRVWARSGRYLKTSQARLQQLEQRGQLVKDQAVLLNQLLTLLLSLLELWDLGITSPEHLAPLRAAVQESASTLADHINLLSRRFAEDADSG